MEMTMLRQIRKVGGIIIASNRNMTKNLAMQRIESIYWAEETNEEDMFHENQQLLRIAPSDKIIIVTSFMTEKKSFFDVYDMKENRIKRLILHGKVIAMDVFGSPINGFEVAGLSFEKRTIMIIDVIFLKVIHMVKDPLMIPGFISVQIPADASSSLLE